MEDSAIAMIAFEILTTLVEMPEEAKRRVQIRP